MKSNCAISAAFVLGTAFTLSSTLTLLTATAEEVSVPNSPYGVKVDNTAMNKRDSSLNTITPEKQSGSSAREVEITRLIRRELVKDSGLSTNAKNVKIITENGKVTLRGPVRTTGERMKVESYAKKIAGSRSVMNDLEVMRIPVSE